MTSYPETHYARSGSVNIAYQVLGDGPFDLVYAPPFVSNMELYWESPAAEFFRRIASFCRLILFDKRGTGLSDRVPVGTLDERIDDIRAVMDGSGSECAALVGVSDGGPMSILFTATYPERVRALVLIGTFAHNNRTREVHDKQREWYATNWGTGEGSKYLYNSLPEDEARAAAARHERLTASPGSVLALHDMNWRLDVRPFLASISVPTLVLHQTDDLRIPVAAGRYIAHKIPGAILRELRGKEHFPELGDWEPVVAELEEFLTASARLRPPRAPSRRCCLRTLSTRVFTRLASATSDGERCWTPTTTSGAEPWISFADAG